MPLDMSSLGEKVAAILADQYQRAEVLVSSHGLDTASEAFPELGALASELGQLKHNGRGVALTLAACKAAEPSQDIRQHKVSHKAGFNARGIDTDITVPFL